MENHILSDIHNYHMKDHTNTERSEQMDTREEYMDTEKEYMDKYIMSRFAPDRTRKNRTGRVEKGKMYEHLGSLE